MSVPKRVLLTYKNNVIFLWKTVVVIIVFTSTIPIQVQVELIISCSPTLYI